jgi:hypothetical protein
VKSPVPVVFVVFDEFSGTTLMNDKLEIDAVHFPQFARLAKHSTWYRKMTTVHPRTGTAVPAILSGRFPVREQPPVAAEFPGNLLQVIESTKEFDMAVFEPATRLCPKSVRYLPEPTHSFSRKTIDLIYTLAVVYPRLLFARDTPIDFPKIPLSWFGAHENTVSRSEKFQDLTEGLFAYSRGLNRDQQLDHFLRCLRTSDRNRFCFMHAMIPHYPWCYLPTGEKYQSEAFSSQFPPYATGELGEDWPAEPGIAIRSEHRYRLQVGFIDHFIGRVLDRLEEAGIMDECLLIVTSDHGVSFHPGHSRRQPDANNIADIMSVPLFIKLPGQTEGRIDDRNVESVDLLPTIADVLGIDLPEPVDGIPVSKEPRRPRKTIYFEKTMAVVEPDFPQLPSAALRQAALFGTEPLEYLPPAAASHYEWHGSPVSQFKIDDRGLIYHKINSFDNSFESKEQQDLYLANLLINGQFIDNEVTENAAEFVLVVDGIIRDTRKIEWAYPGDRYFEFFIPDLEFAKNPGRIELYIVDPSQMEIRLRPLKLVDS